MTRNQRRDGSPWSGAILSRPYRSPMFSLKGFSIYRLNSSGDGGGRDTGTVYSKLVSYTSNIFRGLLLITVFEGGTPTDWNFFIFRNLLTLPRRFTTSGVWVIRIL